jgi:hypothetical protein
MQITNLTIICWFFHETWWFFKGFEIPKNWLLLKNHINTPTHLHLHPLFGPLLVFTTFTKEYELYPYPRMNMKNWTYTNSVSLLTVPTLSFSHEFFPKKLIESEIHTFKIKEMRRLTTDWRTGTNRKISWNHYSDKFIVVLILKY